MHNDGRHNDGRHNDGRHDVGKRHVVIVGGGIGGLSAGIRLAAAGHRVTLFEKNAQVGGKMSEVSADGFRWDTGPSVITMRPVFEELFAAAGRQLDDYLTLLPVEPLTRYFYPDGTRLDATQDLPQMDEQIRAIDPRDVAGYRDFLHYAATLHQLTGPVFIYDQPPNWRRVLQAKPWRFLQADPWLTLDQAIRRRVHSPHLRQLLGRFATYVGASPFQAPATLGVIADVELAGGVWYPQGGIYAIARAMAALAQEVGVVIHSATPVDAITVAGGRAGGVRLADGTQVAADAVLANVDVTTVYQHLLPAAVATPARRARLTARETSCSGYVLLLGVEGNHPQLAHHNIFFSADYRQEFEDIFQHGRPPEDPTVYVAITSKTNAGHAPDGCENWFVLVNAPATGSAFDWSREESTYRAQVLAKLAAHGVDIRDRVRTTRVLTPGDLAAMSGAWRGALYGISSNQAINAFRRPHNRSPHLKDLYFAGGTTHPGGGVPMVTLSGKVAADMIQEDWQR